MQAILSELDTSCVSILGDWNADISDVNSMFAIHLKDFCSDTGMVISDEAMLAGDTFTQLSERWHSTSWLDHCLSTSDGHNLITAMHVQYGTSCRDHIPLIVDRIDQVDNYRPIALASVISKIVEIILLSRISGLLETCHNQFGFKQSLGTDTCIYVLKEIVDKYRSLNGGLFMCFL